MRGVILFLFLGFWLVVVYFGWIYMTGRIMKSRPTVDSSKTLQQQRYIRQQTEETRERQKQLMIDRQQRLRDMQRR